MKPWSLRHATPAFRTFAGDGALGAFSKQLERSGAERVVLVCGRSMVRATEAFARVESALGARLIARFTEVEQHSPLPSVLRAADVVREGDADTVVALGGGSAVVTARAAVVLAAEGQDIRSLATHRRDDGRLVSPRLEAPKLPLWVIASTPTTAYAKAGAAVHDPETGERLALFDPKARASGLVLDEVVAATSPVSLLRSSALNVLGMCVDGLQGSSDPLADASLRHALHLVSTGLEDAARGVEGSRLRLMVAALLAGEGSDHVGTGLAQPLSHALGPMSTVGNGVVEALLLPHVMTFNAGVTDGALRGVAEVLAPRHAPSPEVAVAAVGDLLDRLDSPRRLRDVGIDRHRFDEVVAKTVDDWSATSVPRPADADELLALLDAAW